MDEAAEQPPRKKRQAEKHPGLITAREGALKLGISEQTIYQARKARTLPEAVGPDVPEGIWFREADFTHWAETRQPGRRPSTETKMGGRLAEYAAT